LEVFSENLDCREEMLEMVDLLGDWSYMIWPGIDFLNFMSLSVWEPPTLRLRDELI
jgi:hypothetical protein